MTFDEINNLKQNSQSSQTATTTAANKKYTCLLCKRSFDKPASGVWYFDIVRALAVNLLAVVAIILGFTINSVAIGISLTLLYAFCWGFFIVAKKLFGKKLCPHCKSENFIKN